MVNVFFGVCEICSSIEPGAEESWPERRRLSGGGVLCERCVQTLYDRERTRPSEAKTSTTAEPGA
jgi:hypothetical protein